MVKWELGFCQIFTGKMRFGSLGFGITNNINGTVLGIGKGWEMGFGQNLG